MAQAQPTWTEIAVHPSSDPEVYTDLEGNIRISWPIPELAEGSRVSIAIPLDRAQSLARAIENAHATATSGLIDGPAVTPLVALVLEGSI